MIDVPDGGMCRRHSRALVLVLIAGTAIEQAPSVGPLSSTLDGKGSISRHSCVNTLNVTIQAIF